MRRELMTRWGRDLDPETSCRSTPGRSWSATATSTSTAGGSTRSPAADPPPTTYDGPIVVPFSPEAPLSGVGRQLAADERLWYRRGVTLPHGFVRDRVLLHFGAVDQTCRSGSTTSRSGATRAATCPSPRRHRRAAGGGPAGGRGPRPVRRSQHASGKQRLAAATSGTPPSPASGRPSGWSRCRPPASNASPSPRTSDGERRGDRARRRPTDGGTARVPSPDARSRSRWGRPASGSTTCGRGRPRTPTCTTWR